MNLIIFSGIGYIVVAILFIFNKPVNAMIADDIAQEEKNKNQNNSDFYFFLATRQKSV